MLFDSDIADWKEKVSYVGTKNFDGAKLAGRYIANAGDMDATVAQAPYDMGKIGVQTAIDRLRDKRVKKSVDTGAKLVEPGNVKKYFAEVRAKLGGTGRGGN